MKKDKKDNCKNVTTLLEGINQKLMAKEMSLKRTEILSQKERMGSSIDISTSSKKQKQDRNDAMA